MADLNTDKKGGKTNREGQFHFAGSESQAKGDTVLKKKKDYGMK